MRVNPGTHGPACVFCSSSRGPASCPARPPASPRPTVWRFPYRVPAARCFEGPWFVGTSDAEIIYSTHPTHAEAISDAWARTHPKEETPC